VNLNGVSSQRGLVTLEAGTYKVIIRDASPYADPPPDLGQLPEHEYDVGADPLYRPTARHVVECWEADKKLAAYVLRGWLGATGVHKRTALIHGERCVVAVSAYLAALRLPGLEMEWILQVDDATCFGVYHLPEHACYISHGEMDIARISYDGQLTWSSGGKDIFTNGFEIKGDSIEAVDFNDERYRIDIATGESTIVS
jgi:hypothetical protein